MNVFFVRVICGNCLNEQDMAFATGTRLEMRGDGDARRLVTIPDAHGTPPAVRCPNCDVALLSLKLRVSTADGIRLDVTTPLVTGDDLRNLKVLLRETVGRPYESLWIWKWVASLVSTVETLKVEIAELQGKIARLKKSRG